MNKKLFKNLSKSRSNETKSNNDAESEVDATDDDVDYKYNIEVSNIFSPLQVPQEESKVLAKPSKAPLSRPPLPDQQDPCTAPPAPSSSCPRSPVRTPPPTPLNLTNSLPDSDQSWDIAMNGEFQKIQQELDKVNKILEEYQPSGSRGTCST